MDRAGFHSGSISRIWESGFIAPRRRVTVAVRTVLGALLAVNFMVLWLIPIVVQGRIYRRFLQQHVKPVHDAVDRSAVARAFASRYIYRDPSRADYFATAVFFLTGFAVSLTIVFWQQVTSGYLPWWLIVIYYFMWVGFGGRAMGAAYTFAHREGHAGNGRLYRPWIRKHIGNLFENRIGLFYGNVPYNFSTSHVLLHHRLNAGKGDPFYMWDIDRTKPGDLMLYHWRVFLYMTGWSSLAAFRRMRNLPTMDKAFHVIRRGMAIYWLLTPAMILGCLLLTGSSLASAILFLVFIYFQPLFAMSSFLTILNVGFHGFLEFDEDRRLIPCVCSSTVLDGADDLFGENDHMTHHDFGWISHDGLVGHHRTQQALWAKRHASVFRNLSVIELSLHVMLGRFEALAEKHYVDYSAELSADRIAGLLEARAKRREMGYADYEFGYLPTLESTVQELVRNGTCRNLNQAYVFQARQSPPNWK